MAGYYSTKRKQTHHGAVALCLFTASVIIAGYSYVAAYRQLPVLQPTADVIHLHATAGSSHLIWPEGTQAAVSIVGSKIIETHGNQQSVPIASAAKVITALVVLDKKPLKLGESGPTIQLTDKDVALYRAYLSVQGSIVPVLAGETITESQMIEALMLPSANNLADSLAVWAFGSLPGYTAAANKYVSTLGLKDTHIGGDASGFLPSTTSTAHDLVILGNHAMQVSALRAIVAQPSTANIPLAGRVDNVNFLLGTHNIIGLKTGNTEQAGGVYLSASTSNQADKPTTIITAVVGASTLYAALQTSLPLIDSAQSNFVSARVIADSAVVGEYDLPWGGVIPALAATDLTSHVWAGSRASATVTLKPIDMNAVAGQIVGTATDSAGNTTDVILQHAPVPPSVWWRLQHPF